MTVIINLSQSRLLNLKTFKARQVGIQRRQIVRAQPNEEPFAKAGTEKTSQELMYENQAANAADDATRIQAQARQKELQDQRQTSQAVYETFTFAGVPEDVNGRMCMMAMAFGMSKEFLTGQSIAFQSKTTPIGLWIFFFLFIIGSIIPSVRKADKKEYAFGPFSENIETLVGRTAMLGFAGTLIVEVLIVKGPVLRALGII